MSFPFSGSLLLRPSFRAEGSVYRKRFSGKDRTGKTSGKEPLRERRPMDWFERLTGFRETGYDDVRLCTRAGLDAITRHLDSLTAEQTDMLRGLLRIGVHRNVEVTEGDNDDPPVVSQAFCSALAVAYSRVPPAQWT
jgi:hypothetical protein